MVYRGGQLDSQFMRSEKKELPGKFGAVFESSYVALRQYVRVGGLESDLRLPPPGEFAADTSKLIQMLKKGHHNVKLDAEARNRLITRIDLNAPCHGTWAEVTKIPGNQCERRLELRKLYGGVVENCEEIPEFDSDYDLPKPVIPEPEVAGNPSPPKLDGWPFSEVRDAEEAPFTPERALSIYTFNRAYWESRFYDEAYWAKYLDVLAQNRFNSLVVIFGYENGGFLAPCYPCFFDVEEFPDVRMVGITPEQQRRNLAALKKGLATLERQRSDTKPKSDAKTAPRYRPETIIGDGEAPVVTHQPVVTAPVGKPLAITAEVRDSAGVKWVRLRCRNVNQHQDYRTLPMLPTGEKDRYRAVIPVEDVVPAWDLMYFIEAMDQKGHGKIHPDLNKETPYVVVRMQR